MRVGVVNRFDGDKRQRYPFRRALDDLGATYVPIDVRDLRACICRDEPRLTIDPDSAEAEVPFGALRLDGVLWRVSENTFNEYGSLIELISRDYPVANTLPCLIACSDKWRTALALVSAGIPVVPTTLMLPGMAVPDFAGARTLLKPRVGAGGRGVRTSEAGVMTSFDEPHVAQPLVEGSPAAHVRVVVCGSEPVGAMHRIPAAAPTDTDFRVNNVEAGGHPAPAALGPVSDIAAAAATCLDGAVVSVDLVQWNGGFAVLEVNACPGLTGMAQVTDSDLYSLAARAVLERLDRR